MVEGQTAADVLLGRVPDLGVHDPVGGEVGDALAGDPLERVLGLQDCDGVLERLQVAHQRAGVGRLGEPVPERLRILRGEPVSDPVGQLQDGLRPEPPVEVVVEEHLRGPPDLLPGRPERKGRARFGHGLILAEPPIAR
jgi:hypothetical protein